MRFLTKVIIASLLAVNSTPKSAVTLKPEISGCLLQEPNRPLKLTIVHLAPPKYPYILNDRVISPIERVRLRLQPGYYYASIRTPRCWRTQQPFVVGSGLDRDILLVPGITLGAPRAGVEQVAVVDYVSSAGLVLHSRPQITRVLLLRSDGFTVKPDRAGTTWFFDWAPVGRSKIMLYIGARLVLTDTVALKQDDFVERFYR